MKVLLLSANTVREPYPVYPLGLDYVAGAIAADHTVRVLDMNRLPEGLTLEDAVGAFAPEVIGLSLRNIDNTDITDPRGYIPGYRDLVERVRRCCNGPVILGGSGFTLFPREIMDALAADYGIVGEGERLGLLLDALANGQDPLAVPGVIVRGGRRGAPPPLAGAGARRFDPDAAHTDFYLRNGGMLNLQTKRGCPFRCVYCTYPRIEGRHMRCEPPEIIGRIARQLQEAGAKYIFLTDSAFNADIPHSLAVGQALRDAGVTIPWGGFFAPTALPDGYFDTLAGCGLRHVEFGTEAFCDAVLKAYGKPFHTDQVKVAHKAAVAAGLHVAHYFLFGGPGETAQTVAESLERIDRLEKCVLFLFAGMRIYPHTDLYQRAVAEAQISTGDNLLEPVFYRPPGLAMDHVITQVTGHARQRDNWVVGAGGEKVVKIMARMYRRGFSGPLWEYLVR
ncbi:lipid biosynthesis B12-binding/radical SAM protein [Desulfatitalea alkaliphila]|uniref:Cobalamin-dependent protein n=1 Tax=Desulfatitalea alkaliphila TaxID=2929485 RepID=A0AA41UKM9_9BACT|nr:lipid biosynthesis B12-binding/radical SAM protein [Desulfatitalea alkaliphila]MCJ8501597.1 cobalamin-dependent protein [Desulfatitalea alkaliphila]